MKEIIEILEELKPGIDYKNQKSMISDGILSSFDLIMLISMLNNKFGIDIGVMELLPENFETVEAINSLVEKLKN